MKKLLNYIPALLVAVILIAAFQACTGPQQRIAVNSLSTTHQLVDSGIATYFTLVAEGKATTNDVPAVAQSYREFQAAFGLAIDAVQLNSNAPAPASVTVAASKVLALTGKVK